MHAGSKCNMDLSPLRALMALRDLGCFARVAERVHLSTSAVFCQIRQLEVQLGQKLYERKGKWLLLTATGRLLADYAEKIVYLHDSALSALKPGGPAKRELVRVGCGPHASVEIVPHLLHALVKRYPTIGFRMTSADEISLIDDLRSGLLDAVLMSLPARPNQAREFEQLHLWRYELVLVFPPSASGLYPKPGLEDLRTAPFIRYRRPVVIDAAQQQLCRDLGFELDDVMENDEADSIKELVRLGLGLSFLALWSVASEESRGTLRIVRPLRPQVYDFGLLYRKSQYEANMLSSLLKVAAQWRQWWPHAKYVLPPDPWVGIQPEELRGRPQNEKINRGSTNPVFEG
jgi:DNA-binding transcriptional LysR family regulator